MELNHEKVLSILPDRAEDARKGDFGKILLLCGSKGYTGAAYLAAMGALRSGAGLLFLGVPESIYAIEAVKLNEAIVFPLPDKGGKLSNRAIPEILERLPKMDAVLIGPGLGQSGDVLAVVRMVLQAAQCPVVLDADGINVVAPHKDIVRGRTSATILTPHAGEFTRLGGSTETDRMTAAEQMAQVLYQKIRQANIHSMIVTMGGDGAVYADIHGDKGWCAARSVKVRDTTGAGDAFCAGAAIGLTYGKNLEESCRIGSQLAASVIVTSENVCPRFMPRELGLDMDVV